MTEDQADKIISLLEEIKERLEEIGKKTAEISDIESNTANTAEYLRIMTKKSV